MLRKNDLVMYWITRLNATVGGDIPVPAFCNGILVVNVGTIKAFVNGFPINPPLVPGTNGESWSVAGNFGEVVSENQIEVLFDGAAGGNVFISFKVYTNIC